MTVFVFTLADLCVMTRETDKCKKLHSEATDLVSMTSPNGHVFFNVCKCYFYFAFFYIFCWCLSRLLSCTETIWQLAGSHRSLQWLWEWAGS